MRSDDPGGDVDVDPDGGKDWCGMQLVRHRAGGRVPPALDVEVAGVLELAGLRHDLGRLARDRGYAVDRQARLTIAVDEVVAHALDLGARSVRVRWCSRTDGVRIRVDMGLCDPPAADALRVATTLAEVTVLHSARGTTVRLAFPSSVDDQSGGGAA
ncbi:hypothetical protein GCM10010472_58860 [Pseudonocardia halophobica]|uniref:Uncharacterized protein n=1 Tax=Pseudonocardia halophobica TaxID=29401 RepID=A0A9W6UEH9_9PSEU|nr:ATP-binding protein [Pseudonocardia halophobica]GLL15276.1 hypothetical protein GCM10017577_64260 [Pseudonocardia halophobica]